MQVGVRGEGLREEGGLARGPKCLVEWAGNMGKLGCAWGRGTGHNAICHIDFVLNFIQM